MIHFEVYIEKYDWSIDCYITVNNLELNKIMCRLENLGCSDKILTKAYKIMNSLTNTGFAYSSSHRSIMVINMSTSMDEFINTYNHEKNHIEMHICDGLGIDPFSEEAADLSGYLAQKFYFSMLNSL